MMMMMMILHVRWENFSLNKNDTSDDMETA